MRVVRARSPAAFAAGARRRARPGPGRAARAIVAAVRRGGDAAVTRYERRFGEPAARLRVGRAEVRAAYAAAPPEALAAAREAARRLRRVERKTRAALRDVSDSHMGVTVRREFRPIPSVGCYVPGGLARYPSSAVMAVVPAAVAGVPRIAVATPPGPGGRVDPLTLAAADMCGATEIYAAGGAQAIAALAYGTESVRPVAKIVGPGGPVVTAAKEAVSGDVAIDMRAGPTELCIVADSSADARLAAADLASQAEHSADAICYMVTDSAAKAAEVNAELGALVRGAPREAVIRRSLRGNGFIAVCRGRGEMAELAELLAPEHLQVMARGAARLARGIRSPGLVLLGPHSPSAASDYMFGSNHVLPTGRAGAARGPLSVLDFLKLGATASATREGLRRAAPPAAALARYEGLHAHAAAAGARG